MGPTVRTASGERRGLLLKEEEEERKEDFVIGVEYRAPSDSSTPFSSSSSPPEDGQMVQTSLSNFHVTAQPHRWI